MFFHPAPRFMMLCCAFTALNNSSSSQFPRAATRQLCRICFRELPVFGTSHARQPRCFLTMPKDCFGAWGTGQCCRHPTLIDFYRGPLSICSEAFQLLPRAAQQDAAGGPGGAGMAHGSCFLQERSGRCPGHYSYCLPLDIAKLVAQV